MTGGSGKARGALDRIGRDRPGLAADAAAFPDAVAPCPAATRRWFPASGADPDPPVDDGFPALHLAIGLEGADRAEVIALLLGHGAAGDGRGANDRTALHRAACALPPPLDLIALPIDRGADRTLRTRIDDPATAGEEAPPARQDGRAGFIRDHPGPQR